MASSLPMYDWPEMREATDDWWAGLARCFRAQGLTKIPDRLDRCSHEAASWGAPGLLFSQTCGYPLTHEWAGRLQVIATPCYDATGCAGHSYNSAILVRESSGITDLAALRGTTAGINGRESLSGHLALQLVIAPLAGGRQFFGTVRETGAHARSLIAVRNGQADVCAIDAVVLAIARRYRPDLLDGLIEIARSPSAPALPYVTRGDCTDDVLHRLRRGLAAAFADPSLVKIREALLLKDIAWLKTSDYDAVLALEQGAVDQGYSLVD